MKASDIMTRDVVTVKPETSVREIAELMTQHRISGLPVVNAGGRVVGILSESDLLHRAETGTEKRRKWWMRAFIDTDQLAREYAASHARNAGDIMSKDVVSVDADMELGDVAELLDRKKLKRLPVTQNGQLAGMITRGDLVRALTVRLREAAASPGVSEDLARSIRSRMQRETWLDTALVSVSVDGGEVELAGLVASHDQRRALRLLVEDTPGVKRVDDKLSIKPSAPMV
jgi:CBS domain-containing protein